MKEEHFVWTFEDLLYTVHFQECSNRNLWIFCTLYQLHDSCLFTLKIWLQSFSRPTFHFFLSSCSKVFALQVIFKVAEPKDQDATAMRPVSKGPSVNVARRRLPEASEAGYKDMVRPIEDVRSFRHQVTKGRYDRWACIVLPEWVVRRVLRLQAWDLIHIKRWKHLWEPARKICLLIEFFYGLVIHYCIELSIAPAHLTCFLLNIFHVCTYLTIFL